MSKEAKDFLQSIDPSLVNDEETNDESPFRLNKEESKAARIRKPTWKLLKYICWRDDKKMIDLLEDLIHTGLQDPKYAKYLKDYKE